MAQKFELHNRMSKTIPVEIDGKTYQAKVGSSAVASAYTGLVAAIQGSVDVLRGIASSGAEDLAGAAEGLKGSADELDAKARECLTALLGKDAEKSLLGDERLDLDGVGAVAALVKDVVESDEYRKALGKAAQSRVNIAGR